MREVPEHHAIVERDAALGIARAAAFSVRQGREGADRSSECSIARSTALFQLVGNQASNLPAGKLEAGENAGHVKVSV